MIYYEMALFEISMEPSYQKVWLVIVLSQAALIVKIYFAWTCELVSCDEASNKSNRAQSQAPAVTGWLSNDGMIICQLTYDLSICSFEHTLYIVSHWHSYEMKLVFNRFEIIEF